MFGPRESGRQWPLTTALQVTSLPNTTPRRDTSGVIPRDLGFRKWKPVLFPVYALTTLLSAADPWADAVLQFDPGVGGAAGYDNPTTALGPPTRLTGQGTGSPMVVSPFSPAWMPDEIVSLGAGGSITLTFATPIADASQNPFGIDLIVFGNAGFVDMSWPNGICGGLFGADGGDISLSADGVTWVHVDSVIADGPWPTLGWLDAGPYDESPGLVPADPTRAIDPMIDVSLVSGMPHDELVELYDGSAGGVGIDLADVGLDSVTAIRIDVPADAFLSVEIDAVVDAGIWNAADLNGDGAVTVDDLLIVIGNWDASDGAGDADGDGVTGVNDLLIVLKAWT